MRGIPTAQLLEQNVTPQPVIMEDHDISEDKLCEEAASVPSTEEMKDKPKAAESSSSESSSDASSDTWQGDPPPVSQDQVGYFQWFVIGKTVHIVSSTVHIVSSTDDGSNLSICREELGQPFKTKPRLSGTEWSDTIEQFGVCKGCAGLWFSTAAAPTPADAGPSEREDPKSDFEVFASPEAHSQSSGSSEDSSPSD